MHRNEARPADLPAVVKLEGRLDYASVRPAARRLAETLGQGQVRVVVDMSGVESLTSGALGALLLQQTEAERQGGRIHIASVRPPVYQVLKSNNFTTVFEIYDSVGHAVEAFQRDARVA